MPGELPGGCVGNRGHVCRSIFYADSRVLEVTQTTDTHECCGQVAPVVASVVLTFTHECAATPVYYRRNLIPRNF
jgi:hypothetical protein